MDPVPCSLAEVFAALDRGAAVVTGNQRAARTLLTLHRSREQLPAASARRLPTILAWKSWTASLWQQLVYAGHEERLLLNPQQELLLWRELIAADEDLATLRTTDALATLAADAFALLHRYGGRNRLVRAAVTGDARAFVRWAERFDDRCRKEKLLPAAALENELAAALAQSQLTLPGELLFLGFDGLTPAQQRLLHALQSSGTPIQLLSLEHVSSNPSGLLLTADDEQTELIAAAQWARDLLHHSPQARLALIVPNLEEERAELERVLRNTLAPTANDIAATQPLPYEFSLGSPLTAYPMAAAAFELLRWIIAPLPVERIGALLLSPYLCPDDPAERSPRAEFDAFALRQASLLRPELSLQDVLSIANHPRYKSRFASLARQLAAVRQHAADHGLTSNRKRHHGEWMEEARALLRAAGWPGTRTLDSLEFQLHRKWDDTLDQLAALDFTGERVSFPDALRNLEHALTATRFAPQSHNAPLQVMGVLESAGSLFDAVWFLRGSDATWPRHPSANPLLPWLLQRSLAMPGVSHAQAQQESRALVQRISRSAPQVVFSYAAANAEGPQRRSSIIAELPWPAQHASIETAAAQPALTEPVAESPLPALASPSIRGGESVLRLQAACGFRAFAERRLFSSSLDSVTIGLDAREWGILLHDVVRRFWSQVQTQANLRAMDVAARDALLTDCIAAAFRRLPEPDLPWDTAYLEILQQRLHRLLSAWSVHELDRPPFTVLLNEEAAEVEVGPLRLTLRIDRVDQVEGGEVLIDYKTGNASRNDWSGPRPEEPQLPLYAAFARNAPLQAIAFARLRPGKEMKFEGFDAGNGALAAPVKQADMFELLAEWHASLEQLAWDFAHGRAVLNPKDYPTTCQYCAQRLLCRLDPATLSAEEDSLAEEQP